MDLKTCIQNAVKAVQDVVADYSFKAPGGGKVGSINQSGDHQLDLDVQADRAVERELRKCSAVAGFCSEEREGFVCTNPEGRYIVVYDPLDGSQNVPVGISVGSIFGAFEAKTLSDIKSGRDMVFAAYGIHAAALLFVSTGNPGVNMERYDRKAGCFVTVKENIKIPNKGKTYCINEGNSKNWSATISDLVAKLKSEKRSVRWAACMVSDVHRPLLNGGIFSYPRDAKYQNGRLRLVYEAYPMAYIWECADGSAFSRVDPVFEQSVKILDEPFPEEIHSRSGVTMLGPHETQVLKSC